MMTPSFFRKCRCEVAMIFRLLSAFLFVNLSWNQFAAADETIVQAGQMYLNSSAEKMAEQIKKDPLVGKPMLVKSVKIHVGDKITFKNLDKVTHNVYGDSFDLKAQAPNETRSYVFDKPCKQVIKCAIHPKMSFEVEVDPKN